MIHSYLIAMKLHSENDAISFQNKNQPFFVYFSLKKNDHFSFVCQAYHVLNGTEAGVGQ